MGRKTCEFTFAAGEFLRIYRKKVEKWNDQDKGSASFAVDWALAVCSASTQGNGSCKLRLGIELGDFDLRTDTFDDWAEAWLVQMLGVNAVAANGGNPLGVAGIQPIIQVTIPTLPQPSMS